MTNKVTLLADDLWVLRSVKTLPDKTQKVSYYETPAAWNSAPTKATIFTAFDAAEVHMGMLRDKVQNMVWADGTTEVFEIVPLGTEILHSPNATQINLKKK